MSVITRASFPSPTLHSGRHRRRIRRLRTIAVLAVIAACAYVAFRATRGDTPHDYLANGDWPTRGQASIVVGSGRVESSPGQRPVPIASVAKVMTAYLVLRSAPLSPGADGFSLTVTEADAENTLARQRNEESVVPVEAGEVLTERQALAALLLPSANNVATMLARHVSGSVESFVNEMNRTAQSLRMKHTTYTDPSGLDESTRSTGADQILLARVAMRDTTFASIVATPRYELPVAGAVRNTDTLLGRRGFVGIKTGSDDAAGGCFMFRTKRIVNGRSTDITGIVLGQQGDDLIASALNAASQLADRVAPAP